MNRAGVGRFEQLSDKTLVWLNHLLTKYAYTRAVKLQENSNENLTETIVQKDNRRNND